MYTTMTNVKGNIDPEISAKFRTECDSINAGSYSPKAENEICPNRAAKANQWIENLSEEDQTELEMMAEFATPEPTVNIIVDDTTGDEEFDNALKAFRKRQHAWCVKMEKKIRGIE